VIIDLNGFSIKQSDAFKLIQRFFNAIELAPAPFIPKQGPGDFINDPYILKGIHIRNGTLENLSHNGIHGNSGSMIYLKDLTIKDFEVSGIQLNGYSNVVIENCCIKNTASNVKVSSLFSNAIFARLISKDIPECNAEYNGINNDIEAVLDSLEQNTEVPSHCQYLVNDLSISDCNVTGIVLNTVGVAVNDLKVDRGDADITNHYNVLLRNITIKNIVSSPIEILGISKNKNYDLSLSESYSNKVQVGITGDVFPIVQLIDTNKNYVQTKLSNLQIAMAKYNNTMGTCNISNELIDFTDNNINFDDFIITKDSEDINANLKYHIRGNLDVMSHTMKGNMGLFISAGKNVYLQNVNIDGVYNHGEPNNTKHKNIIYEDEYRGNQSIGIMITGSTNIRGTDVSINNIISNTGKSYKIKKFGKNTNIII